MYNITTLEVTAMEVCLTERDSSGKLFGFEMAVPGSTRITTTVKKLDTTDLQHILTPPFITVDMFTLVVQYLFFCLICC